MSLFERFYLRVSSIFSGLIGIPMLRLMGVHLGKNIKLLGLPIVVRFLGSQIVVGNRVILCSLSGATALGVNHPVILRTLAPHAVIEIGDDVGISGGSICAGKSIQIGHRSMLGANVTIADTDFHDFSKVDRRYAGLPSEDHFAPVTLEENVFIGTNAIILKGVTIGRNAVIGAGSVVTHDIPANTVAAGNPCKVLKTLSVPMGDKL